MYTDKFKNHLNETLQEIKEDGLYKEERIITSKQGPEIEISTGEKVLNFCANNYLGLSANEEVIQAAKDTLDKRGYGMSSVRFICGTQDIHKELEQKLSDFYGKNDAILYAACFDANGGIFEPLFTKEDAILSDSLNHASIIDGVRLCKAARYRYANGDMEELEEKLKEADKDGARFKIIATDGVFSMDGLLAPLEKVCDLADKYDALVMVDESHATGYIGSTGVGTPEAQKVLDRVDLITGTLGKALGGAMGGYTVGKQEIIDMLRQRSRPYLFSNSLAPSIVGASIKVLDMLKDSNDLKDKVMENTRYFKNKIKDAGFEIIDGDSAIVPVMLHDAQLSQDMANRLLEEGIYVIGFFYPVVPKGEARIRVQLSAAHTKEHLNKAVDAFIKVGKELEII